MNELISKTGSDTQTEKKRVALIDEIRGITLILMVIYHAFYLYKYIFTFSFAEKIFPFCRPFQPFIAISFIFLAGISCSFSHSNLRRGIRLFLIAMGVTVVTAVILPLAGMSDLKILFGVLHLLSICMITAGCVDAIKKKAGVKKAASASPKPLSNGISAALFLLLFILTWNINDGFLGFGKLSVSLPQALYSNFATAVIGFPPDSFSSADYFPLLPHALLFFSGVFAGRIITGVTLPPWVYKTRLRPLSFLGRHSLIVYLAHQPVLYVIGLVLELFTD